MLAGPPDLLLCQNAYIRNALIFNYMNWKLIFLLSLFGLAMAFATVFWIPTRFEPFCWLAIFAFCAWTVAKRVEAKRSKLFLHGFMISILNGLWITAVHLWFVQIYLDL